MNVGYVVRLNKKKGKDGDIMYPNYFNPYAPQMQQATPNNSYNAQQQIPHVTGENGARAFQLPPNSQVLLLDDTAAVVWLKTTDGAGYPTLTPYNIVPAQTQEQKDASRFDQIERRITSLEAMINEKSNTRSSEPEQTVRTDSTV